MTQTTLDIKIQLVFQQLRLFSELPIKDDTLLQKLHTNIYLLIQGKENQIVWSNSVHLLTFIRDVLEQNFIDNKKNHAVVVLGLMCFSSLLHREDNFLFIQHHEIFQNFIKALSIIQKSLSLSDAALDVVSNILDNSSGCSCVKENDIWKQLLLQCLKLKSIFVHKKCIKVMNKMLLKIDDSKIFCYYIDDLKLVLSNIQETRISLMNTKDTYEAKDLRIHSIESNDNGLRFNMSTVLCIYHDLLLQTLGKRSIYSQLEPAMNIVLKILFQYHSGFSSETILKLCKILFLNIFHKFQNDHMTKSDTIKQNALDSVTSDIVSLSNKMLENGYIYELSIASFDVYAHWFVMRNNYKEQHNGNLSKWLSLLYIILRFQEIPLKVVCQSSLKFIDENESKKLRDDIEKWNEQSYCEISISDEQKEKVKQLEDFSEEILTKDLEKAGKLCTTSLSNFTNVFVHHLDHVCSQSIFQGIILFIRFQFKLADILCYDQKLYQTAIDSLGLMISRYDIDWAKCLESDSKMSIVSSVVMIPGMNTNVKVATLKTIGVCLEQFMDSDNVKDCQIGMEKLGQALCYYLSDTKWEVRDSALELLHICMNLAEKKYPWFVKWFLHHNLLEIVIEALCDIEAYVQASALDVIRSVVGFISIWYLPETDGLMNMSLQATISTAETCVRKAGLLLLSAFITHSRFTETSVKTLVNPIVQHATNDPDDEVRFEAVQLIRKLIEKELYFEVDDAKCPSVNFQKQKTQVLNNINSVCKNGLLHCLLQCSKDNVTAVSDKSIEYLNFIEAIIKKYNIETEMITDLESMCEKEPPSSSKKLTNNEATIKREDDVVSKGIEFVVEKSDLDIICKYSRSSAITSLRSGWQSSKPVLEDEVPLKSASISLKQLLIELKDMSNNQTGMDSSKDATFETEFLNLLNDILLDPGLAKKNTESRLMDCY